MNLIVGTTHSSAAMHIDVLKTARQVLDGGRSDEEALNKIEMAIRAYDPCFSCATHKMDGSVPVKMEILDARGRVIRTLSN